LIRVLDALPVRPLLAGEEGLRLSLAGAQSKVPVVLVDGAVALPAPGQPTTAAATPVSGQAQIAVSWTAPANVNGDPVADYALAVKRVKEDEIPGLDLSRVRGPQAELSVVAPRALRVAVTPIGARGLPKQRAFVGMRASAVTRVCGLFDGPWIVELLDSELRPVWWQEVDIVRAQTDLFAAVPASTALAEGGPADAAGLLSAQARDGRLVPWLQFPVRLAGGTASTGLPDGTYRADLQSSAGPWRGVARVGGQRLVLTAMPR
jgi:hypothetical protein